MILKKRDGLTVTAAAEDADDLLALRRVISCGDTITGSTTRVIKRDRDYSRPDRGERVRIITSVAVEKISLDGTLERLRISGTVSESNNEAVPHGTYHSMTVLVGESITITKGGRSGGARSRRWSGTEYKILEGSTASGARSGFILVAVDTADCGMAVLRGTHLNMSPNMYSGRGGKRYKTSHNMDDFFGQVASAIHATLADEHDIGHMILFGPGNTKNRLANYIKDRQSRLSVPPISIAEGIDSGGEDGIHMFTRSDAMRDAISGSKLALVSGILDRIIENAHKKIPRYAMGYAETSEAAGMGAIDSLICSDGALGQQQAEDTEQKMIDLLNRAEESGAQVYMVDSSTDIGLRATGLGGVVALLRYSIR